MVKVERPKFSQAYSLVTKIFVMLYGFFSFDYWFATILDISNLIRFISNGKTPTDSLDYYYLKVAWSSGSSILIFTAWIYVMVHLKHHYNEQYKREKELKLMRKSYMRKESSNSRKPQLNSKSEFDLFVESIKHGGLKKSENYSTSTVPAFCADFNFYFLAMAKFIIIIMVTNS